MYDTKLRIIFKLIIIFNLYYRVKLNKYSLQVHSNLRIHEFKKKINL